MEIKASNQQAQTRAMLSVNTEFVQLYGDMGRLFGEPLARFTHEYPEAFMSSWHWGNQQLPN